MLGFLVSRASREISSLLKLVQKQLLQVLNCNHRDGPVNLLLNIVEYPSYRTLERTSTIYLLCQIETSFRAKQTYRNPSKIAEWHLLITRKQDILANGAHDRVAGLLNTVKLTLETIYSTRAGLL